jgi:ABC-type bacteriocin/lantibiotic exporter with double-glycine peptidase domain
MWSSINPKNFSEEVKCIKTTLELVKALKVKISVTAITKYLEEHPDFPSLLSIADCLENFGIHTLGLKINYEKLQTVPTPILTVHENNGVEFFQIISLINSAKVVVWNSESFSEIEVEKDIFLKTFTERTLAVEPSNTA